MSRKRLTGQDRQMIRQKLRNAWNASASPFLLRAQTKQALFSKKGFKLTRKQIKRRRLNERKKFRPHKKRRRPVYTMYINSPEWRARCNKYYRDYGKLCAACGSTHRLHMHHMDYSHLGNEADDEIIPLCYRCHETYHKIYGTQHNMVATTHAFIAATRRAA